MKFFTRAWLSGELAEEEFDDTLQRYHRHIADISEMLNPHLLEYMQGVNLHDGLIRRILVDPAHSTLALDLRCGNLQEGYYDVDIQYLGIQLDRPVIVTLAGEAEAAGEILFDELDLATDGRFEHRIIFDSYEEISILFRDLVFEKTRQDGRYFSPAPRRFNLVGKLS